LTLLRFAWLANQTSERAISIRIRSTTNNNLTAAGANHKRCPSRPFYGPENCFSLQLHASRYTDTAPPHLVNLLNTQSPTPPATPHHNTTTPAPAFSQHQGPLSFGFALLVSTPT